VIIARFAGSDGSYPLGRPGPVEARRGLFSWLPMSVRVSK
jgi:hypothetical protein